MVMKKLLLLLMFLILIESCLAATIHGTVYDESLKVVKDAVVEVNSVPQQRMVAKDGLYSFTLPKGDYEITVKHDGLEAEEELTIEQDGDYVLDLFLFPTFSDEDELLTEADISIEDEYFQEESYALYYIIGAVVLVVVLFLFYFFRKKEPEIKVGIEDVEDEAEKVLSFIKKEGGRITQKDIRKHFGVSEAKISLVITELEHKNKIQKIRKGRSNIIILKK